MTAFEIFYLESGHLGVTIENAYYNIARSLSEGQYAGGQWASLSDIVFYPVDTEVFSIGHAANYVEPREISNKAFGAYIALVVYNGLAWSNYAGEVTKECEFYTNKYHEVYDWLFADVPPAGITKIEQRHILKMID